MLTLTREIRFGLQREESRVERSNGFAGHPALVDIGPFLTLAATIAGEVDLATGMLINIKLVDRVLREKAVPFIRVQHFERKLPAHRLVAYLFESLREQNAFAPHEFTGLRLGLSPYLAFGINREDFPMTRLTQRFEFSAAHRLHSEALSDEKNMEIFGRCNNPNGHGHNYELEVTIAGDPRGSDSVFSIPQLQKIVNEQIIDRFDHKHLNLDCPEFAALNPTVENIAQVLFRRLAPHILAPVKLVSLRVWETPKTMAEYTE